MLIDRKSRRLGDLAAGTICVKERRDVTVDKLVVPRHQPRFDEPTTGDHLDNLDRLSYDDRHLVQEYLIRRDQMKSGAAQELAAQIASRLAAKLEVDLGDESPEDFLSRVGSALESRGQ